MIFNTDVFVILFKLSQFKIYFLKEVKRQQITMAPFPLRGTVYHMTLCIYVYTALMEKFIKNAWSDTVTYNGSSKYDKYDVI